MQNDNIKDSPEMIAVCVNCKQRRCVGICQEYKLARKALTQDTRGKKGKLYEMDGERMTIAAWAARYGLKYEALRWHIRRGLTIRQALDIMLKNAGIQSGGLST